MRRRGLGVGQIHSKKLETSKYEAHSEQLSSEQLAKLSQQMSDFSDKLQQFATKHKKDIKKNPEFRREFQIMCSNVGVDPLSSSTSFWSKMLGIGDFYYELGVQAIEICVASNPVTGGIMNIEDLFQKLLKYRSRNASKSEEICVDDVIRAVEKIATLGTGVRLIKTNDSILINSVSSELNIEQNEVIRLANQYGGRLTVKSVANSLKWSKEKSHKVLDEFVMNGLVWIDSQDEDDDDVVFWFPGLAIHSK